jgi:CheY-like chemotaxis protein
MSLSVALSGLSILVVDDAVSILKMMAMILSKAGADVIQAMNGQDALDRVMERSERSDRLGDCQPVFDIIVMDIQMPVCDGITATKRIRDWETARANRAPPTSRAMKWNPFTRKKEQRKRDLDSNTSEFKVSSSVVCDDRCSGMTADGGSIRSHTNLRSFIVCVSASPEGVYAVEAAKAGKSVSVRSVNTTNELDLDRRRREVVKNVVTMWCKRFAKNDIFVCSLFFFLF